MQCTARSVRIRFEFLDGRSRAVCGVDELRRGRVRRSAAERAQHVSEISRAASAQWKPQSFSVRSARLSSPLSHAARLFREVMRL